MNPTSINNSISQIISKINQKITEKLTHTTVSTFKIVMVNLKVHSKTVLPT